MNDFIKSTESSFFICSRLYALKFELKKSVIEFIISNCNYKYINIYSYTSKEINRMTLRELGIGESCII